MTEARESVRRRDRRFLAAAVLLVATLCAVLYASTLDAPFTFDDHGALVDNPSIRWDQITPDKVFRTLVFPYNRRPVANLTFALNYYFDRYEVFGYHLVNVIVHFANGLLVYLLALTTLARIRELPNQRGPTLSPDGVRFGALFAALIFVAHPLQIQSVTYVVQRMNSMATFFYLVSLLLYIAGRGRTARRARIRYFVGAAFAGLLAVGSKQNAITLPVAIWFYEAFLYRNLDRTWLLQSAKRLGPPLLIAACVLYYIIVWGPDLGYMRRDFGMGERLLTQPRVVMIYIGLIALPLPSRLNLMHDVATSTSLFSPATTPIALLGVLAQIALGVALAPRQRLWSFAILWFFLHLVVESTILPLEMIFEHRTYLPLVGLTIAGGGALGMLRDRSAAAGWIAASACVVVLGVGTLQRNRDWQDNYTLWADISQKSPRMARAHGNRGMAYQENDRYAEAIPFFRRALEVDPGHAETHRNLAAALSFLDDLDGALVHFTESVRQNPEDYRAQSGLGTLYYKLGRIEDAIRHNEISVGIYADEAALNNLGKIYGETGDSERAFFFLEEAKRRNSEFLAPRANLGIEKLRVGRLREAREDFEFVLERFDDGETHANLASALWGLGLYAEAIEHLETARDMRSDLVFVINDLAWMLSTCPDDDLRDPARAIELASQAVHATGSQDPGMLDTLAAAYASAGDFTRAVYWVDHAQALARQRGDEAMADAIGERSALYRRDRPYLERVMASPG